MKSRKYIAIISVAGFLFAACGSKSDDSADNAAQTKNAALAAAPLPLANGDFSSAKAGWTGVGYTLDGGCNTPGAPANTFPSLGVWLPNALSFGTSQRTVQQEVAIPTPGKVTFSFRGQVRGDRTDGSFRGELVDSDETVSTGDQTGAALVPGKNFELSVTTKTAGEKVTIKLTGGTPANWSGCYGPVVTNASLYTADAMKAAITATTVRPVVTTVVAPVLPTNPPTTTSTTVAPTTTAKAAVATTVAPTTTVAATTTTVAPTTTMSSVACKDGGPCKLGDKGPGGGEVFYVNSSAPAGSRYMEVTSSDFASDSLSMRVADVRYLNVDFRYGDALGAAMFINDGRLGDKRNWRLPSKTDGLLLCLYVRQITTGSDCNAASPGMRPGFHAWYWTADASDPQIGRAWCIMIYPGFGGMTDCKYVDPSHVRFVRTF